MSSRRNDGRGRPWKENRAVLNGILWILRTGAPWADLPTRYPSYQTCHRRFQRWVRSGVLKDVLEVLAGALHHEGFLDLREAFIDGIFAPTKKGGASVGKTKRGKGSKIMAIADCHGWASSRHTHRQRHTPRGHARQGHSRANACERIQRRDGIAGGALTAPPALGDLNPRQIRLCRFACRGVRHARSRAC